MDDLDLYKLMRQIVLIATGCPVAIQANPNKSSPDGEYCAIETKGTKRQRGQAIIREANTDAVTSPIGDVYDISHDIRSQVIADVTINFYRGNANYYASQLFQANKRPDIQEMLFRAKVGWNGATPINNLTALQSENWETRAQIVIRLTYEQSSAVVTNAIYQAPIAINDFDSGETIIETTLTIPNP